MAPLSSSIQKLRYGTGLQIIARNYLDVYPYDKWNAKEVGNYEQGETFIPTICDLRDGETTSPTYLTEADLVTLMDKNGIGQSLFLLSSL